MAWTYEQKFNALADGNLSGQDSWTIVGAHGDLTVGNAAVYEGAKATITNTGAGWMGEVYRDINSTTTGTVYVALRQTAAIMSGGFILYATDTSICTIGSAYNQNWYLRATADTLLVTNYTLNSWYLFALQYDTDLDQCRVKWKIAGGTYSAWTDWKAMTASAGINRIRMGGYNDGAGGSLAIDCITPTDPEPDGIASIPNNLHSLLGLG